MSRLEAFRKRAKQLVRWHREGNYSIGERIRMLPRYRHLTDVEALKLKFPLAEAQEIVSREAGFETWAGLKASMDDVPSSPQPVAPPVIKAAVPMLFVSDVSKSAGFFRDKLGFTIDFLHGQPAFYAGISRNGVVMHLRFVHAPVIAHSVREQESLLAAFVSVANAKALFEEYKKKDVPIIGTLEREPWGGPQFIVADPDGNRICFCEA